MLLILHRNDVIKVTYPNIRATLTLIRMYEQWPFLFLRAIWRTDLSSVKLIFAPENIAEVAYKFLKIHFKCFVTQQSYLFSMHKKLGFYYKWHSCPIT